MGGAAAAAAGLVLIACGRSENVGWADREMPDSVAARASAVDSAPTPTEAAQNSLAAVTEEYQQLAEALREVQMEALADSQVSASWNQLIQDVDSEILGKSKFHRQLMERRSEIEGIFLDAQRAGREIPPEQRAELTRHYRNIGIEMWRIRNQVLRTPEFAERYLALQKMLFDKMRALAPDRLGEVNRLEQLESEFFKASMEAEPAAPGFGPPQ
jgi:hypothetical protein